MLWGVFSLGGFISAFLLPVLIYINSIAYPLGLWPAGSTDPTSILVASRLSTLFIFVTVAGSLFHGMFRFISTLPELGLRVGKEKLAAAGYAIIGTGIVMMIVYLLALNPGLLRLA
jgi:fumarate reductase subunit D